MSSLRHAMSASLLHYTWTLNIRYVLPPLSLGTLGRRTWEVGNGASGIWVPYSLKFSHTDQPNAVKSTHIR